MAGPEKARNEVRRPAVENTQSRPKRLHGSFTAAQ
jgi:hypothetical protein